jgi:Tfp pilus assembly protein PilF
VKEDKNKTDLLYHAYGAYSTTKSNQFEYAEAAIFAEECYNIVAIAYNPVYSDVQRAASNLVQCLTLSGDQTNAKHYAEMSLDSLRNRSYGVNQESEEELPPYYTLITPLLYSYYTLITTSLYPHYPLIKTLLLSYFTLIGNSGVL